MTKKPYSTKTTKKIPQNKHIQELAADDYVDAESRSTFSDSDIFANQGVTVRNSDNESRELGASKTLAQDEDEEKQLLMQDLKGQPIDWLKDRAKSFGIPGWSSMQKNELIKRLGESASPPS